MPPENIGIQKLLETVYAKPGPFAERIANKTLIDALRALKEEQKTREDKDKKDTARPLNLTRIMAQADAHPTHQQIANVKKIVIALIREHSGVDKDNKDKGPGIDSETRDAIARTCMELLGDYLVAKGHSDLGHFIHNTPHIEKLLFQLERLAIMERDIIPDNQVFQNTTEGNDQIWIGHDTDKGYQGQTKPRNKNIILALSKVEKLEEETEKREGEISTPKRPDFRIQVLLKGDYIHVGQQTLVFSEKQVTVHSGPTKTDGNYSFATITQLPVPIDEVSQIESEAVRYTGWNMHRITGKIKKDDEFDADEEVATDTKFTICVNNEKPDLSFITRSKRYKMGQDSFVIDTAGQKVNLLSKDGIRSYDLGFTKIIGVIKHQNEQALYFLDDKRLKRKMVFAGEKIKIYPVTDSGEVEFFSEKKK